MSVPDIPMTLLPEEDKKPQVPAPKRTPEEEAIIEWLRGNRIETPAQMERMMGGLMEKINWFIAFSVVQNMSRVAKMSQYLEQLESQLFDTENVEGMDSAEMLRNHRMVSAKLNEFMEFARRFVIQNKALTQDMPQTDKLATMLREMDPAVLAKLKNMVMKDGSGSAAIEP